MDPFFFVIFFIEENEYYRNFKTMNKKKELGIGN